jgi:hypothetical protein
VSSPSRSSRLVFTEQVRGVTSGLLTGVCVAVFTKARGA